MPFVHIRLAGPKLEPLQRQHLHREATRFMATIMGKDAELTAVLVEEVDQTNWAIGGKPVRVGGHMEVKITEGSNTEVEKAEFINAAFGLLRDVLGEELSPASYVVVDEVPAEAWGYGGLSQAQRRRDNAA
ncbi:MAG: tautomerase family protein [Rhizobiaceae bacterium]